MSDEQALPKKKVGRPPKSVKAEEGGSATEPTTWFGHKQKLLSRTGALGNTATDEVDVLSLAFHNGMKTDEDITKFLMNERILNSIELACKSLNAKTKRLNKTTIITRYYSPENQPPENPDPRILYTPSPPEMPSRWAIEGSLTSSICSILDHRFDIGRMSGGSAVKMVTFKGSRRELASISDEELEVAEAEVMTGHGITMMRDLIIIRGVMLANSQITVSQLLENQDRYEESARAAEHKYEIKVEEHGKREREFIRELCAMKFENEKDLDLLRNRARVVSEEGIARVNGMHEHYEILLDGLRRLSTSNARTKIATTSHLPLIPVDSTPEKPVDETIAILRLQLEDARLEITRLKDEVRSKAVPKPKVHRKTKDPDLHLATEADIKSSVKAHLSEYMSGSVLGTPISSTCSRAKKAAAFSLPLGSKLSTARTIDLKKMEEKEAEAARELKTASRLREQDLVNAESASEQLSEVVEALSSILTRVSLTIEDVAMRRTSILNYMRSLAHQSRRITTIIRERPYLLALARRMNRERRPMVNLSPLRALINVASDNFKALQQIECITLDSVGGLFEVMSLDEAAEAGLRAIKEEESWIEACPEAVISVSADAQAASSSPGRILTRATLRRHTVEVSKSSPPIKEEENGSLTD